MSDDESLSLGLDNSDALQTSSVASPYRVLARKYRPQSFAELIGQDAMVQTLANAIKRGRIAHAFLLTGVRGVGKTSTARLVAKALNCIGPDGTGGPTITPCGVCEPCRAIADGRHIDVIEMDAASHTGVDDVREIIDGVRYSSVSARYKIYIIDEVHMLSKNAFNALLKTLEEPPEHVKFLFATTEVNKVPVTVLSRCQRFDLRRIPADKLTAHFAAVADAEGMTVEPEAIGLIARASEGSARDGLSILDQAIAHGAGSVTADQLRHMLGLADGGRVRRLLGLILAGDAAQALGELDEAHSLGIDPGALLRGLMEELHGATRIKAGAALDQLISEEQRTAAETLAKDLSWASIHRLWQMLLKALGDVAIAPDPNEAATMGVLRLIHAADLPDPAALLAKLNRGTEAVVATVGQAHSGATKTNAYLPKNFGELVALVEKPHPHFAQQLRDHVGLVRYAPPELVLKPLKPMGSDWSRDCSAKLKDLTQVRWQVSLTDAVAQPSLRDAEAMAERQVRTDVLADPSVQAVFDAFPDAELESFTILKGA
jgi:DNA polymerase-3 subunit gamma/tau